MVVFELCCLSASIILILFTIYLIAIVRTYGRSSRAYYEASRAYRSDDICYGDELMARGDRIKKRADRMSRFIPERRGNVEKVSQSNGFSCPD